MMWWQELLSALALVLVLEGIVPAANPQCVRQLWKRILDWTDFELRISGVISMLLGLLLLYLVR